MSTAPRASDADTIPALLQVHNSSTLPDVVKRYLSGESLTSLAQELGIARRTIYNWLHRECGNDETYRELQRQVYVGRIADADEMLESASDAVHIARAREIARYARWDAERRLPHLFGPKSEVKSDTSIKVIIERSTPQPVVVGPVAGEVVELSAQNSETPSE